jgi:hypothetical protein
LYYYPYLPHKFCLKPRPILVVALSLFGKLALKKGDITSAIKHSTEAVNYLEKMGTMALVRVEEIFFNHHSILEAADLGNDVILCL